MHPHLIRQAKDIALCLMSLPRVDVECLDGTSPIIRPLAVWGLSVL